MTQRRRALLMGVVKGDEYPPIDVEHIGDWNDKHRFDAYAKSLESDDDYIITPFFKVSPGNSITFWRGIGPGAGSGIAEMPETFTDQSQSVDYWSQTASARTITLNSRTHYVAIAIYKPNIGNAYIKNNTTNKYIFKGNNVL